jgi:hypothetical protein
MVDERMLEELRDRGSLGGVIEGAATDEVLTLVREMGRNRGRLLMFELNHKFS